MGYRGSRTAATVAQLLGVEGYSDFVHNQVKRYWHRIVMKGSGRRVKRLENEFSAFMAEATEAEKLLVGRFISQRAKESFDTGLRIGLMAHAFEHDKWLDESSGDEDRS